MTCGAGAARIAGAAARRAAIFERVNILKFCEDD